MSRHSIATPVLHPYVRISKAEQRKGGGLERQTNADLQAFCKHFGFTPGKKIYVDDGVSAWQGLNATPNHELGRFLADARKKLIPPGDCLLIESYDRLSRQDPWAAIGLVSELRSLQIHVGRLDRMKLLRYDSKDYGDFFEAAVEFMRGNSESEAKSMRNGEAWKRKRKEAREKGKTITRRLPDWIEDKDGERKLRPGAVATMKRIFHLAASGYGHALTIKRLGEEGVPPFKSKRWTRPYIARILCDRRVLGELQPRKLNGEPDGEVIRDYFPRAITEEEWFAARAGAAQRKVCRGRQAKHVNVFAGLVKNALDGDSYYCVSFKEAGKQKRLLLNAGAAECRAKKSTFPFGTFEQGVLSLLREINPHEILNGGSGPDETLGLSGELLKVEAELGEAIAFMNTTRFNVAIGKRVSELEERKAELTEQLAEARQKARHPLSETWGECQTLLDAIDQADDPNDMRLRLQSVLRRIVDSIQLLVVARGMDRLACVQIWFAGGKRYRDYLLFHRPVRCNGRARAESSWWARSLATVTDAEDLDLRRREDAEALEEVLQQMDLTQLQTEERRF